MVRLTITGEVHAAYGLDFRERTTPKGGYAEWDAASARLHSSDRTVMTSML